MNFIGEAVLLGILIVSAISIFLWVGLIILVRRISGGKKSVRRADDPKDLSKDPDEEDGEENEEEEKKGDQSEHDIGGGD